MLKQILFCIICFVGMVVGEILAHYIASRTRDSSGEILDNRESQEDINNLKSKIDGR